MKNNEDGGSKVSVNDAQLIIGSMRVMVRVETIQADEGWSYIYTPVKDDSLESWGVKSARLVVRLDGILDQIKEMAGLVYSHPEFAGDEVNRMCFDQRAQQINEALAKLCKAALEARKKGGG